MESIRTAKTFGLMVLLVLVLICLFSSFHIVNPGQRGVSVVLGKVDPTPRPEGIVFKKPFIENIINVTVKNISQADVTSCSPRTSSRLRSSTTSSTARPWTRSWNCTRSIPAIRGTRWCSRE